MCVIGAVSIDIYREDKKHYNIGFSGESEIYELLWYIDNVFNDSEKGNKEAIVVISCFEDLIFKNKKIKGLALDVVKEYYYIQIGKNPIKKNEVDKEITQIVAERLNITKEECEKELYRAIKFMIKENYNNWYDCINKTYKSKIKIKNDKLLRTRNNYDNLVYDKDSSNISDESLWGKDYARKYLLSKKVYKEKELPDDLKSLIETLDSNRLKLDKLSRKKGKTEEEKKQLNKLIKFNKQLQEDINILKEHYKIPFKDSGDVEGVFYTNDKNKFNGNTTFEEGNDYCNEIIEDNIIQNDEWQVEKIKHIAKKELTPRQNIIFNLYFFGGLRQDEIGEIIEDVKNNISRDLKYIISKIKSCL